MRQLKLILILVFVTRSAAGQKRYTYDAISTRYVSFFSQSVKTNSESRGSIEISLNRIVVNKQAFEVRKKIGKNLFKTSKGRVRLVKNNFILEYVQVLRYNTLLTYHINNQEPEVAAVLNK